MAENVESHWGSQAVSLSELSLPSLKARFLVERLPVTGRVLEIGCGNGKVLRTAAAHRPKLELFGCDVREPTEAPDVYSFRRVEVDLPFDSASMDVVLIFDVLEHVPDPRHLLTEAVRVLRPGGQLIAFVPVEGEPLSFYELFRRVFGRDTYVVTKEHVQSFTHAEAVALLSERFEVSEVRYAYHALGHLMDAGLFAATRAKRLRDLWWTSNTYYNPNLRDAGPAAALMNALLVAGNFVAAVESTLLAGTRLGSAGILVSGRARAAGGPRASAFAHGMATADVSERVP
jgi:SAM-dependent methyltransferase